MDAVFELVVLHGVAGLSVDAVAAAAGCGKATIYRRWASKEELVADALRSGLVTIEVEDTGSLRGDLERYADVASERFRTGRIDVVPHLAYVGATNTAVREALTAYNTRREASIRLIIQRGIERGELDVDVDVDMLLEIVLGPITYRSMFSDRPLDAGFTRRLVAVVLDAVAPFAARGGRDDLADG